MRITYAPRGILQIDDARIIWRNFTGREEQYNRAGERNFSLLIPNEELANELVERGWNVKIKEARDRNGNILHDEPPFIHLPVKLKYTDRGGPAAYLISGGRRTELDEESIACLDDIEIRNVDLDIRPYDWTVNGKSGRTAYLHSIEVTQEIDRFAARYAEEEYPED